MAGTIIKRGENKWQVRIYLGRNERGITMHFNKTIHGTKKAAEKYLRKKLYERDSGQFVEPSRVPLGEYLDKWLEEVAKPRVRQSTFSSYKMILSNYVKPGLGHRKLSEVRGYEIQKLYNDLRAKPLSGRTVRYVHNVLSSAFKQAIKWKILIHNPCEHCDLPKVEKSEMKYFTPDETKEFLEAMKADKYYPLFLVAIYTGLRPEEYLALRWSDLDLEGRKLSVKQAIVWRRKGGGFDFTEPKTKKSSRTLDIPPMVATALIEHRRVTMEARMKLRPDIKGLDLVFTSNFGTPVQPKNLRDRHFFPVRDKAGLPKIRLYDLRHTFATLMLRAGVHVKVVSEMLGHSSIVLTLDTYSHVMPAMQREASDQLEKYLFGT